MTTAFTALNHVEPGYKDNVARNMIAELQQSLSNTQYIVDVICVLDEEDDNSGNQYFLQDTYENLLAQFTAGKTLFTHYDTEDDRNNINTEDSKTEQCTPGYHIVSFIGETESGYVIGVDDAGFTAGFVGQTIDGDLVYTPFN